VRPELAAAGWAERAPAAFEEFVTAFVVADRLGEVRVPTPALAAGWTQ
jgi:hypothetical protein